MRTVIVGCLVLAGLAFSPAVRANDKEIKVGIIGLDTSHVIAFSKILNDPKSPPEVSGTRVVAAYPAGNPRQPSSRNRVEGFTKQIRDMNIEIVDNIDDLLKKVDVVLLESVDGGDHLEQVEPCFRAGKLVFIDKPMAGSLSDALKIHDLARKYKVRWFSSSSLRYQPKIQELLNNDKVGKIIGADTFGTSQLATGHADLAFYGIHGIEILYTLMGTGCESVTRVQTGYTEKVTGTWKDGRVGTYRGIRDSTHKSGYGASVFGTKGIQLVESGADYKPLLVEIVKFFKTGKPPISEEETLELMAFIEAADTSKHKGGAPVKLADVIEEARKPLDYKIKVETILKNNDGKFYWYHPRVAAVPDLAAPGKTGIVMTLQKYLNTSDYFSGQSVMNTRDMGATWSKPEEREELGWRKESDTVDLAVCDVTPNWHPHSGKVLAIGARVRYTKEGKQLDDKPRSNQTAYAILDPKTNKWTEWKLIDMPDEKKFNYARSACAQWVIKPDGTVLLPFHFGPAAKEPRSVTIVQCSFDGKELKYLRHGTELEHKVPRGIYEPSLIAFNGRYYLTMRNDQKGYVAVSKDGLNFEPMKEWTFDDAKELGNYNTQQHWVAHGEALYLVYTRRGAENDHVFRHRAPLFIAQVDTEKLQVIRKTERVLIPERGVEMGNFGITAVSENETWVTVGEGQIGEEGKKRGADGSVFLARIQWSKPNKLGAAK